MGHRTGTLGAGERAREEGAAGAGCGGGTRLGPSSQPRRRPGGFAEKATSRDASGRSLDEAGKGLCSARYPREREQGDWLRGEAGPRRGRWDRGPQPLRPRTPTSSSSGQKLVAWPFPFSMAAVWFLLPRGPQWPGHHLCALNEPFGQRSTCPEHLLVQGSLGDKPSRHQTAAEKPFLPRASAPFLESVNLTIDAQEKR